MTSLIGEFDCKVDAKGRFMFPVNLRKQLEEVFDKGFVINRNLHQKCLVLYPINEWNTLVITSYNGTITQELNGKLVNEGKAASVTKGRILLQYEGYPIDFKQVVILRLK